MATTRQRTVVTTTWASSVGKKAAIAVTGVVFLLYVIAHMLGNLKIFWGATTFNDYSFHLRTLSESIFGYSGVRWIIRVVLFVSVVLHLGRRGALVQGEEGAPGGLSAPPHPALQLRRPHDALGWGDHRAVRDLALLDLTTGIVDPDPGGGAYAKLVASFDRPLVSIFYILAVVALGFHIRHGLWSAIQTLGGNSALRQNALKAFALVVAVVVTIGFAIIPLSVMTGLVR